MKKELIEPKDIKNAEAAQVRETLRSDGWKVIVREMENIRTHSSRPASMDQRSA